MAENLTFCTAFTTPNLKTAPNKIFRPLSKNLQRKCVLFIKLPDKQNYVTQNAENCTILFHFVPHGTKISVPNQTCHLASIFFNLLRLHAMPKMLRQLRFDDCPSSKLHVCKKNARKACKAFADVFSFDISKTKTPKNSGLFCRDLFRFFLFTEVQSRLQVVGEFVFFEELVKLV